MLKPLLTVRGLVIEGFADGHWQPIVNGINLDLKRGEVLGLIGESGAGKSTIGLAAMGYSRDGCRLVSGSTVFDGVDLATLSDHEMRRLRGARIAYVAQSAAASFNPAHRLIRQYTEMPTQHGLLSRAEAEQHAKALYRRLDLPDPDRIGYRYPHQVSGGQLQRAMVAMAMSCRPDLIIFDEPTTALDVTTQIEVLAAIKEIVRGQHTAAIYISHDLAVVAQLADRIMVLRDGYLVEEGDARTLLTQPQKEYTRQLLSVRRSRGDRPLPPGEPDVVLHCEHVSARYEPEVTVLDDIGMSIQRGQTVAVVGESGSGKSTLARVITGLLAPFEGQVMFNGQVLPPSYKARRRDLLRRLQMIYQMPDVALNPRQKVHEVLGRPLFFYFGMKGIERQRRIAELLSMVELPADFANRYSTELSGGEKQRICIARALAAQPDMMICDEVTSALDQLVAEEILKLLQRLQNELGVSYLFITHDLATVKAIADAIIVMYQGRIVEQGSKMQILMPPHHDYTERLLSSVPEMDPDWLDRVLAKRSQG
ncbi:MAG: ABC transporter ATP-binding protein [Candidatus Tectomicrobia bacterium]